MFQPAPLHSGTDRHPVTGQDVRFQAWLRTWFCRCFGTLLPFTINEGLPSRYLAGLLGCLDLRYPGQHLDFGQLYTHSEGFLVDKSHNCRLVDPLRCFTAMARALNCVFYATWRLRWLRSGALGSPIASRLHAPGTQLPDSAALPACALDIRQATPLSTDFRQRYDCLGAHRTYGSARGCAQWDRP